MNRHPRKPTRTAIAAALEAQRPSTGRTILDELTARGYCVMPTPGTMFRAIALPNEHTHRAGTGAWTAVYDPGAGFSEREARAVAHDRGGSLIVGESDAAAPAESAR